MKYFVIQEINLSICGFALEFHHTCTNTVNKHKTDEIKQKYAKALKRTNSNRYISKSSSESNTYFSLFSYLDSFSFHFECDHNETRNVYVDTTFSRILNS